MFSWVIVLAEHREVLGRALPKAWQGGAGVIAELSVVSKKRRQPRPALVAWPDGATKRRAARWPDVLTDWHDIYEDRLFPDDACAVAAEEVSGLGADALIVHGAPGLREASIGWFAKGALVEYEHVGAGGSVAWSPETGLGRPLDGSLRQAFALGGKKLAELIGSDENVNVAERIQATSAALGEVLISRALLRVLGQDPPPVDEVAGLVATARKFRVDLI